MTTTSPCYLWIPRYVAVHNLQHIVASRFMRENPGSNPNIFKILHSYPSDKVVIYLLNFTKGKMAAEIESMEAL